MELLEGSEITAFLDDIVHEDTQVQPHAFDLTAGQILKPNVAGDLDFGGSEFKPASTLELDAIKRSQDDTYGWWNLTDRTYMIRFNESINDRFEGVGTISPHEHLTASGASIPTVTILGERNPLELPVHVGPNGCQIKENARVATLTVFK